MSSFEEARRGQQVSEVGDAAQGMTTPTGVHVLYSDFATDSAAGWLSEHELDRALGAAQIITENGVSWLLLRQELDGWRIKQEVVACVDLRAAILAFEQELACRVQSGKHHTVTRSPWTLWPAATMPGAHR